MSRSPAEIVRRYELDIAQGAPINRRIRELHVLGGLNALEVVVTQRIAEVVGVCREHGASWSEIAATLHVSKQAAHERFGHRKTPSRSDHLPDLKGSGLKGSGLKGSGLKGSDPVGGPAQ